MKALLTYRQNVYTMPSVHLKSTAPHTRRSATGCSTAISFFNRHTEGCRSSYFKHKPAAHVTQQVPFQCGHLDTLPFLHLLFWFLHSSSTNIANHHAIHTFMYQAPASSTPPRSRQLVHLPECQHVNRGVAYTVITAASCSADQEGVDHCCTLPARQPEQSHLLYS